MNIKFALNQNATYWEKLGIDGFGKPQFSVPKQIKVRWKTKEKIKITPAGEVFDYRIEIWFDFEPKKGSYIAKGDYTANDPNDLNIDVYIIENILSTPSVDGKSFVYKAIL